MKDLVSKKATAKAVESAVSKARGQKDIVAYTVMGGMPTAHYAKRSLTIAALIVSGGMLMPTAKEAYRAASKDFNAKLFQDLTSPKTLAEWRRLGRIDNKGLTADAGKKALIDSLGRASGYGTDKDTLKAIIAAMGKKGGTAKIQGQSYTFSKQASGKV